MTHMQMIHETLKLKKEALRHIIDNNEELRNQYLSEFVMIDGIIMMIESKKHCKEIYEIWKNDANA